MACQSPSIPVLTFCNNCGSLRLRDVTKQLQELFTKKSMKPDLCGICNRRVVDTSSSKTIDASDSAVHSQDAEGKFAHASNEVSKKEELLNDDDDDDVDGGDDLDDTATDHNQLEERDTCILKSVPNSSLDYEDLQLNQEIVAGPHTAATSVCQADGPASFSMTADKSKVGGNTKSKIENTSKSKKVGGRRQSRRVAAKSRSKPEMSTSRSKVKKEINDASTNSFQSKGLTRLSAGVIKTTLTSRSKVKKEINDASTDSFQSKRRTRLSAGVIKTTNYQSLFRGEKMDDDDDGEREIEEESHATDDEFNPDNSIDDEEKEQEDIDISKYIISKGDTESKSPDKDNLNKLGADILDPALKELVLTGDEERSAFKCKLCGDYLRLASQIHKHITSKHPDVPTIDRPFVCMECGKKYTTIKTLSKHKYRHKKGFLTYRCTHENCKFTFNRKDTLISHIEVHQGKRRFQCNVCGAGFNNESTFTLHKSLHSGDQTFTCEQCKKVFTHPVYFRQHVLRHKSANKFKCELCSYACAFKTQFKRHHQKVHQNAVEHMECERCKRTFKYKSSFGNHIRADKCVPALQLPNDQDLSGVNKATKNISDKVVALMGETKNLIQPFRCKHCQNKTEFKNAVKFLTHLKETHAELHPDIDDIMKTAYKCSECNQGFKNDRLRKSHLFTHTIVRPHKCKHPGCGKMFKHTQSLHLHTQRHGEKRFICSWCGKRIATKTELERHQRSVHLKLRPHKCSHCEKHFACSIKLKTHERRVHLKLKPYVCEKCGRAFPNVTDLKAHNRYHTGEKPYKCDECDYECIRVDYLAKHKRRHTGEKPYQCKLCDMSFAYRTPLVAHKKKSHGIEAGDTGTNLDIKGGFQGTGISTHKVVEQHVMVEQPVAVEQHVTIEQTVAVEQHVTIEQPAAVEAAEQDVTIEQPAQHVMIKQPVVVESESEVAIQFLQQNFNVR